MILTNPTGRMWEKNEAKPHHPHREVLGRCFKPALSSGSLQHKQITGLGPPITPCSTCSSKHPSSRPPDAIICLFDSYQIQVFLVPMFVPLFTGLLCPQGSGCPFHMELSHSTHRHGKNPKQCSSSRLWIPVGMLAHISFLKLHHTIWQLDAVICIN